jgi:hypothetical protein
MSNQFLSKFDNTGTYQSQTDITDTIKSIVRDCRKGGTEPGNLTSYYIRNNDTLCKYEDGIGEVTYVVDEEDGSLTIRDIALNRDGSRLYFVYNIDPSGATGVGLYYNYVETNSMTVIGTSNLIIDGYYTNAVAYCNIDKDNWLWVAHRGDSNSSFISQVTSINIFDDVKLILTENIGAPYSSTINKDSEFVVQGPITHRSIKFHRNASNDAIQSVGLHTVANTKDMKFMTDGKLVYLTNNDTDSSIEVRSGSNYSTLDYSLTKTGELFYHLLLDSNNRIYADRYEIGVKERYRWLSDLTRETMISDSLASNLYNCDDTGYIHSEMTGMSVI